MKHHQGATAFQRDVLKIFGLKMKMAEVKAKNLRALPTETKAECGMT